MSLIDKIKAWFMDHEDIVPETIEKPKRKLDVVLLYCNYFDTERDKVNLVFYLDFDETKTSILELMKYGKYDHTSHLFRVTYDGLFHMRMDNRRSELINDFFANISTSINLEAICDPNLDHSRISTAIYDVIKMYAGFGNKKLKTNCGVLDFPEDFDHYDYTIRRLNNNNDIDTRSFTLIKMTLIDIPYYFLEYLIPYIENPSVNHCKERAHMGADVSNNFVASFEGRSATVNETIAIYNVINYANTCPESVRSSILPQGCAVCVEFTITLDRIFTCLARSGNEEFSSYFKNKVLTNIFTEEDIERLSYTKKKDDKEIEYDFDREIDEIILVEEEVIEEDENR